MATIFCEKMAHSHFSQSGIQNGLQYRNFCFRILNRMNFSTLCTILVTFGPVTPEIARATTASCWMRQQKLAYPTEYLSNYETNLRQPFSVSSHICGDYRTSISFAVA